MIYRSDICLDIHCAFHEKYLFLMLLNVSAAFDIVDHCILSQHLMSRIGLGGTALRWIKSYLDRTQSVLICGGRSCPQDLAFGVPQGLVLSAMFFAIYMI